MPSVVQDQVVHVFAETAQSSFFDVRLEQTHVESSFQCKQLNIHSDVTFAEDVSIKSESWVLWTSDVDSAATAVQAALETEDGLKDFRFMGERRQAPLDNLPRIANGQVLRR
jgi:hypothetical protein